MTVRDRVAYTEIEQAFYNDSSAELEGSAGAPATCDVTLNSSVDQGVVHNCVNIQRDPGERCTVVIRHLDRVGVLAAVLDAFRQEELNVQEMQNVIFAGNEAASATLSVEGEPSAELVASLESREDVLAVAVRPR